MRKGSAAIRVTHNIWIEKGLTRISMKHLVQQYLLLSNDSLYNHRISEVFEVLQFGSRSVTYDPW